MPRLEGNSNARFLIGGDIDWTTWADVACRPIFDEATLDFLDALSLRMLADPAVRGQDDLVAFAFWIRRSALERLSEDYRGAGIRLGRGTVFHICPANVPIMSAYSLVLGLLAGNRNLVRVPSLEFTQIAQVCAHLEALLAQPEHEWLRSRIGVLRYPRESSGLTRAFSAACDIRVIWGGDATISAIREFPLRPGAGEMTFPDRFSIAIIQSEAWLESEAKIHAAKGFFNDTMSNDQASCSAPRLIVWQGNSIDQARTSFWQAVQAETKQRRQPIAGQVARALEYAYGILAALPASRLEPVASGIVRVWTAACTAAVLDGHPGGGVFIEVAAADLAELVPLLSRRCQTISYFGIDPAAISDVICRSGTAGGDRIVPLGQTRQFSPIWDGHDTIRVLSRAIGVTIDGYQR